MRNGAPEDVQSVTNSHPRFRPLIGTLEDSHLIGCAGTLSTAMQIAAVMNRRYPVVDEEASVVMATAIFNRPPGAKRRDGTPWPRLLFTEFFPIENDRFTAIYAAMFYLPPEAVDSGWKE